VNYDIKTNDKTLLAHITNGDEKAFNILFEKYRNRFYNHLVKVTKSKEIAEEATLDVFFKIWNARQVLNQIENFESFLFRVLHNKGLDYLRKAKRSRLVQQEIWSDLENLASSSGADERLLTAETENLINKAISHLTPQRKEAFRLSREEFLSYDQIAERMQISPNTVRNHISSALQFIKGHLDKGPEIATIISLVVKLY
jgi:RNA polymerase sigma-70 factor (family 1)